MKKIIILSLLVILSCKNSDLNEENIEEFNPVFINISEMTLTNESSNLSQVSSCYDSDGYQGRIPAQCSRGNSIPYNYIYTGKFRFYSGDRNLKKDVTQEILDNMEDYLIVFYSFNNDGGYEYEYLNEFDKNGKPVGINFKLYVTPNINTGLCPSIDTRLVYSPNMNKNNVPMRGKSVNINNDFYSDLTNNSNYEIIASVFDNIKCN